MGKTLNPEFTKYLKQQINTDSINLEMTQKNVWSSLQKRIRNDSNIFSKLKYFFVSASLIMVTLLIISFSNIIDNWSFFNPSSPGPTKSQNYVESTIIPQITYAPIQIIESDSQFEQEIDQLIIDISSQTTDHNYQIDFPEIEENY